MSKVKLSEKKAKEAHAKKQLALRIHCNRCGANDHETNQCPHHPFKREEVHLLQEGCCLDSDSASEFNYS